jgi:hypothetical protein
VTWQHLTAFVWLRWRLSINQWRRAGTVNFVLMMIVAIGALVTAVPLFFGCFALGLYLIPRAQPAHLMYAWDGLIVVFLFFWGIGLLTELQRSEPLALSKFLHLPVAPNGAFLINYISSLLRLSLIVFGPLMLGFALALVAAKGMPLLPTLPLLAAFLLMVTALTYQFQGWLGSLMSNPRRRRTVVVAMTLAFILVFQLPNLLNFLAPWGAQRRAQQSAAVVEELKKLEVAYKAHEFDASEHLRRQRDVMEKLKRAHEQADRETMQEWQRVARLANMVLPIGWLPLGVMTAAEGRLLPSLLGLAGMTLIGTVSLWRAYRTTVGQYQGQSTLRRAQPTQAVAAKASDRKPGALLLEARLPGMSEPVTAIALAGLRSLLRAPEAKMMLLTPVITAIVFGSLIWNGRHSIAESIRPLIGIGVMGFVLLGVLQLMGNQFGFDRDGFRVYVLSAARRRDILLGKNLAFAPIAFGIAAVELAIVQAICPMRLDHFLAMIPLYVTMFLLFCFLANLMSIYTPIFIPAGALNASNPKVSTVLIQLAMALILFPLTQALALLPLGAEAMLRLQGWTAGAPVCLLLAIIECAAIVVLYRLSLDWQGGLLQQREQRILEVITKRAS